MVQQAETQPCSSSPFNHGQHLDSPIPCSHPCSLLLPPGTSFALQCISISARHVYGSSLCQARRVWELPGSGAKSSSPDESPAIRSVPCPPRSLERQHLLVVPATWDTNASSSSQEGLWDVPSFSLENKRRGGGLFLKVLGGMCSRVVVPRHWDGTQGSGGCGAALSPSPWAHSWRHFLGQGH